MGRKGKRKKKQSTKKPSWLGRLFMLALVAVGIIAGVYYFASFETRAKMEGTAAATLNTVRTDPRLPGPITGLMDAAYDWIPSTRGLIVEGGELGRDPENPFLAGVPNSRRPIRPLHQSSYINLFNEGALQAACIALRLDDTPRQKADMEPSILVDARVPRLSPASMSAGQWSPFSLVPTRALIGQHGQAGAKDAALASNYAPMTQAFAEGPWQAALHTFAHRYPKRFGEIWLYLGPAYRNESSKLASGVAIPDAFYLIALDLTEAGGLRALALLIPADAKSLDLNSYRTSIQQVEQVTGLQFLPELHYSAQETLRTYVSPTIW
jgi:DNA/RNA endonuclease G (NUC1)